MNLKELEQKRLELRMDASKKEQQLLDQAQELIFNKLKDNTKLKELLVKLEESKDLASVEHYESFLQWVWFNPSDFIDTDNKLEVEAFERYMNDFLSVLVDLEHECLYYSIGPAIVINEDGDVLDQESRIWIIDRKDYENEAELRELLNKHMDKSGYYPSVVTCDRYGNAFYFKI